MLLDVLRHQKADIEALVKAHGGRSLRVFGSVARGEETESSDIDMLVVFEPGYDVFAQRLSLAERLAGLTGRNIDLIPEHELSPHLRDAVLLEARTL
ncbi:MAG: nucleotidyltransferase family protein [Asticcacaulis sp.]